MNYRITIVESSEGFAVWCDDLPGCVSQGKSKKEATDNIKVAIREYLDAVPEVEARFGTKVVHEEIGRLMPRFPGVGQKQAERALGKCGFHVIRQGKHVIMSDGVGLFSCHGTTRLIPSRWEKSSKMLESLPKNSGNSFKFPHFPLLRTLSTDLPCFES